MTHHRFLLRALHPTDAAAICRAFPFWHPLACVVELCCCGLGRADHSKASCGLARWAGCNKIWCNGAISSRATHLRTGSVKVRLRGSPSAHPPRSSASERRPSAQVVSFRRWGKK